VKIRYHTHSFTLLICIIYVMIVPQKLLAQSLENDQRSSFKPAFSVSGSFAPYSFKAWGKVRNSRQLFLNIGFTHTELEFLSFRTQLSSEFIVSGLVRYPLDGRDGDRNTLFGIGMIPLIANMPLNQKPTHPFITSSVGFIVTHSQFPNLNGARLNFLLGLGAGYQFISGNQSPIQVGWKLSHLSNGFTAPENPGIDSVMLFVNFLF